MTAGLDLNRIRQNVQQYWQLQPDNWPAKVISPQRAQQLQLVVGLATNIRGYITCDKFLKGRTPDQMESVLGLPQGDLSQGAWVLHPLCLPLVTQFDLRGYTQTPAGLPYAGSGAYPPGLGASQWELTDDIPAVVVAFVAPGQRY